jgi:hypothetical protein
MVKAAPGCCVIAANEGSAQPWTPTTWIARMNVDTHYSHVTSRCSVTPSGQRRCPTTVFGFNHHEAWLR